MELITRDAPHERWEAYKLLTVLTNIAIQKADKQIREIQTFRDHYKKMDLLAKDIYGLKNLEEDAQLTLNALNEGYIFNYSKQYPKFREDLEKTITGYFERYLEYPSVKEIKDLLWKEFTEKEPTLIVRSKIEKFILEHVPEVTKTLR